MTDSILRASDRGLGGGWSSLGASTNRETLSSGVSAVCRWLSVSGIGEGRCAMETGVAVSDRSAPLPFKLCCRRSLSSHSPRPISSTSRCRLRYLRSSSRISVVACSLYRAYSMETSRGSRWACREASWTVVGDGLGALRFLDLACKSPLRPSAEGRASCDSASFSSLRYSSLNASGLSRPPS